MQALLDTIAALPLPGDTCRLFHGRGGRFPDSASWTLDWFAPAFVSTSYEPVSDNALAALDQALLARWVQLGQAPESLTWVHQVRPQGKDKTPAVTQLMRGQVPEPHVVVERGLRYRVHVLKGQNRGLFLDMREGRRWVHEHVAGLAARSHDRIRVLNLFAYTCGFSVAARAGGAHAVLNVDMSQAALTTGERNHQLNDLQGGVSYLPHDIFKSWGKITRGGPYQLIVVDPPSYQKGSFIASKDYPRLLRRLPDLLTPEGHALLCLNAPEIATQALLDLVAEHAPGLRFIERLANPPAFADVNEDRSLRALVFQAPPLGASA